MLLTIFATDGELWEGRVFQGRRLLLIVRGSRGYAEIACEAFREAWVTAEQAEGE